MSTGSSGVSLADVFATFPRVGRGRNALALSAGVLPFAGVGSLAVPLSDPFAALLAGFATGAYYGGLYVRAIGGPVWNLVLPGLVAAVVLAIPAIPPGNSMLSEWFAPLGASLTVALVVALWHRHLGNRNSEWAARNFPPSYRRILGVVDT